ncbi:MAG: M15 family metallopeptidase [bacterium]|nr:M15 family metallopeptidase [bacterium]
MFVSKAILTVAGAVVLGLLGFGAYDDYRLRAENNVFRDNIKTLNKELANERGENEGLLTLVEEKELTIQNFGSTIQGISNTVGVLKKLSETDEELLQKYSKIYFLNENYVPARLSDVDERFLYRKDPKLLIHADVGPYLNRLLTSAEDSGVKLLIASAFRSFDTQASLKAGYKVTYGSGANTFSADQGYSEHQLGSTVDFTTEEIGAVFDKFPTDPAFNWLTENAHKYGFILSYPAGNQYYKYEPWHWRFVGVELATKLYNEKKSFYDLDQREIDKYLIKIFD